jgi:hypothetical protein
MVRRERLCCCSSRDDIHHGCLHLEEPSLVQESTHIVDDLATSVEVLTNVLVEHEVQIALAVASFLILETGVLVGQHAQAGSQKLSVGGEDGKLTSVGTPGYTRQADDISTLHTNKTTKKNISLPSFRRS